MLHTTVQMSRVERRLPVGAGARQCLEGFAAHLSEGGIGTLSEIFDAEEPYTARGCVAQAWSVAEVFRAWLLTDTTPNSQL